MRNDQVQTCTMHSVTETGGYNHHNKHRWNTLETGSRTLLLLLFNGAADEKSSRRLGVAVDGIHDVVEV